VKTNSINYKPKIRKKTTKRDAFFYFLVILIVLIIGIVRDWDNVVKGAKDGWTQNHPGTEKQQIK
jgi:hypothetical protein